jgi:CRP/FNR family transcriptional regulator, cyclic AMP receptor protein
MEPLTGEATLPSFDPKAFLTYIGDGRTLVKYGKNDRIFCQGDAADSIFYVHKGGIKLAVVSEHGKEAVVGIISANDFLGEDCVAAQSYRTASATAITQSVLMKIAKSAMIRVLQEEPAFSEYFVAYLLSKSLRFQEQLVDQLVNSTDKRLARALLALASLGSEDKDGHSIPKVSQETLAQMIGATRETANHLMSKFRKLGLIDYDDGLRVCSSRLSEVLDNL